MALLAGTGGFIAILCLYQLGSWLGNPLLMAPFGASCVLIFSLPQSPLSQPANVIGGHLVSTAIGLFLHMYLPTTGWSLGLAVGLAIAAMMALRLTHPPAGADPLVVFIDNPGWSYLGLPVCAGSVLLVLIGMLYHAMGRSHRYPLPIFTDKVQAGPTNSK
ncbi:MAG: HPP family protein [Gammaproteobacteria bacterium]|nr:HPP family protein [Gammaproteobacteria bacterium]MBQ0840702.1 HPP family protein [Gammaproteobacteria bacterium]